MTKLPNIHEMEPDEWCGAMADLWEEFREDIVAALNTHDDPGDVAAELQPKFEPYTRDLDDTMSADQLWADVREEVLHIGEVNEPLPVTYREDEGGWWIANQEYDGEERVERRHGYLAEYALETTVIGQDDCVARRAREAKENRKIAAAYLEKLEETLQAGDPTAADLREHLIEFLHACAPEHSDVQVRDVSPDDRRTRLELHTDGEVLGHILAVEPGKSIEWDDLHNTFDVDDDIRVFFGTDHLRVTGTDEYANFDTFDMVLPSKKDDDLAAYHSGIAVVVAEFRNAMSMPRIDSANTADPGRTGGENAESGYSKRFDQALVWASELHRDQTRKDKDVPYINHLMAVASLVGTHGGDEDQVIAALLHDAIEDCVGDVPDVAEQLEERFGPRVSRIVDGCTDAYTEPKPDWNQRKQNYIDHLRNCPEDAPVLLVALSDKVHNARSIVRDFQQVGDELWDRFNATREQTIWYYETLADVFGRKIPGPLADELARLVDQMKADSTANN